jgi:hypothetical protein
MLGQYARQTAVSVDRSKAEIERTLMRYGATGFAYATEGTHALVTFKAANRLIRFVLDLPNVEDYRKTPGRGRRRTDQETYRYWEQGCRQAWRGLALVIKAKLEAVASGISMFEEEFLANIVLPNGQLVGKWMLPQIQAAYERKKMPALLPMASEIEQ